MERKKFYAVYRGGKVPDEIIQLFGLDSFFLELEPLKPVVRVRVRWRVSHNEGEKKLFPFLAPKMVDLMALDIKPEIEVVVGDVE